MKKKKEVIITQWQDLDGIKNDNHTIKFNKLSLEWLEIFNEEKNKCAQVAIDCYRIEAIIQWLKLFGFDVELVEFGKPRKISKQLYYLSMAYPDWWFAVDIRNALYLYDNPPKRVEGQWLLESKVVNPKIKTTVLIWKDEPIQGKDLAKWEVEND